MSSSKQSSSKVVDPNAGPYTDETVPSYETALRQGAGGGVAAESSSTRPTPPQTGTADVPVHPNYGCSPYTPHGTTRIVIVPAPHFHPGSQPFPLFNAASQDPNQALLPAPAVMQSSPERRARSRFFLALLQAFLIYMLINLLVDLTVTRKW